MGTTIDADEGRLLRPTGPERFGPAELAGLPEPVRRHLSQAIIPGTPLATAARLRMTGHIKVGRWLPTALLPRFGVAWSAPAGDQVTAAFAVGETPVELRLRLDPSGRIRSLAFDRWGDPDGEGFGWHRFGGEITGYASFGGLTVPSAGRLGWHPGGDRWSEGEFFRYQITELQPVGPDGAGGSR